MRHLVIATLVTGSVLAQIGPVFGAHIPEAVGTGMVVNASPLDAETPPVSLTMPGASWVKVWFGGTDLPLGAKVRIRGLLDDVVQDLDAEAFERWEGTSAYFNGDSVTVSLVLGPFSTGSLSVVGIDAGFPAVAGVDSICGATDDRIPSLETRVGRLLNSGGSAICSGGLVSQNAVFLTAGHCIGGNQYTVEFNCPPSTASGAVVHPGPQDQYPANSASLAFSNGGIGNDWAAFTLFPNTTTGLSASAVQGFYDLAPTLPPIGAVTRISGFGTASNPVLNQAPTTHTGSLTAISGTQLQYTVDTTGGNSGSVVVEESTQRVFGIHTNAGCTATGGANSGTSLFNAALQAHLAGLVDPPGQYRVAVTQLGAVGNPITIAINDAPAGAELVNVVSLAVSDLPGTGNFFGLNAGPGAGDVFMPFTLPLGSPPFHVSADVSGGFSITLPSTGSIGTITFDIESLAFNPALGYMGYLGKSPVTRAIVIL